MTMMDCGFTLPLFSQFPQSMISLKSCRKAEERLSAPPWEENRMMDCEDEKTKAQGVSLAIYHLLRTQMAAGTSPVI